LAAIKEINLLLKRFLPRPLIKKPIKGAKRRYKKKNFI
jgi:hypothetical protein